MSSRRWKRPYWAVQTVGLMDMRGARGPFSTIKEAVVAAAEIECDEGKRNGGWGEAGAFVGAWFNCHLRTGDTGGMIEGPHLYGRHAEAERVSSIADPQSFSIDCNRRRGFIAQVVRLVGGVAIVARDGYDREGQQKLRRELADAAAASDAQWAARGVILNQDGSPPRFTS